MKLAASLIASLTMTLGVAGVAVKIMPLGDSITGDPSLISGCWRATVYNDLKAAGYDIDMVGSVKGQDCKVAYDSDAESHPSILVTDIVKKNQLPPWLSAAKPDLVMFHLGTGDLTSQNANQTLTAYTAIVKQMRDSNPKMRILVSQIIPIAVGSFNSKVDDLNKAIPAWATSQNTTDSPIYVVDCNTGFDAKADTGEGVHPNASGNAKLAAKYTPVLKTILNLMGAGPVPKTPLADL